MLPFCIQFIVILTHVSRIRPLVLSFFTNKEECALDLSLLRPVRQGVGSESWLSLALLTTTAKFKYSSQRRARLCISSRNALAESIPISKKVCYPCLTSHRFAWHSKLDCQYFKVVVVQVSTLAVGKELQLIVVVKEHSFEVRLHIRSRSHRKSKMLIRFTSWSFSHAISHYQPLTQTAGVMSLQC